jgi:CspA family cold shock protein
VPISNARGSQTRGFRCRYTDAIPRKMKQMIVGEVTSWDPAKRFGFLRRDDGERDVFLHANQVERDGLGEIRVGDRFRFEIDTDRRGRLNAVDLRRVRGSPEVIGVR